MRFDTSGIEGIFFLLCIIIALAFVVSVVVGIAGAITCIWRETTMHETIDVEVVEKIAASDGGAVKYCILVTGTLPNGEVYCDEHYISKDEYINVQTGDILQMEIKETTQPLFGKERFCNLVFG